MRLEANIRHCNLCRIWTGTHGVTPSLQYLQKCEGSVSDFASLLCKEKQAYGIVMPVLLSPLIISEQFDRLS
jgi:hypothetical protein